MTPVSVPVTGGTAYRIRSGQSVGILASVLATGGTLEGTFIVECDDGTWDQILIPPISLSSIGDATGISKAVGKNGWITAGFINATNADVQGSVYALAYIFDGVNNSAAAGRMMILAGYVEQQFLSLGQFQRQDFWATYVFQGTVAEDATAGTHVCKLTLVPGAGNALMVLGATIAVGATATAQTAFADVQDGSGNVLQYLLDPNGQSGTVSGLVYAIPNSLSNASELVAANGGAQTYVPTIVSGTMQLVLQVNTAAVSVTQTFSVVCRLKGTDLPTATLADTVGSPVLTVNTNQLF